MREICTSGSVGGEGGNILAYPAATIGRHGRQQVGPLAGGQRHRPHTAFAPVRRNALRLLRPTGYGL